MTRVAFDAADRRWRNFPVVRERDPRGVRKLWRTALGAVLAFAPVAVYLVLQSHYVELDYRITRLRARDEALRKEERRLLVVRSRLESPSEIERWAERQPDLVRPAAGEWITVRWSPASPDALVALAGVAHGPAPARTVE